MSGSRIANVPEHRAVLWPTMHPSPRKVAHPEPERRSATQQLFGFHQCSGCCPSFSSTGTLIPRWWTVVWHHCWRIGYQKQPTRGHKNVAGRSADHNASPGGPALSTRKSFLQWSGVGTPPPHPDCPVTIKLSQMPNKERNIKFAQCNVI